MCLHHSLQELQMHVFNHIRKAVECQSDPLEVILIFKNIPSLCTGIAGSLTIILIGCMVI